MHMSKIFMIEIHKGVLCPEGCLKFSFSFVILTVHQVRRQALDLSSKANTTLFVGLIALR